MSYSVILVSGRTPIQNAIRGYIIKKQKPWVLSFQTDNSVEAFSVARKMCPHIIIIHTGLSFYGVQQFMQDLKECSPNTRYILLSNNEDDNSDRMLFLPGVSAIIYSENFSEEQLERSLTKAAADYDAQCSISGRVGFEGVKDVSVGAIQWIVKSSLFMKIIHGFLFSNSLLDEIKSLFDNKYVLVAAKRRNGMNASLTLLQNLQHMDNLYDSLNLALRAEGGGMVFLTGENNLCFLLCARNEKTPDDIAQLCGRFCGRVNKIFFNMGIPKLSYAYSEMGNDINHIPQYYYQTVNLLKYCFFVPETFILSERSLRNYQYKPHLLKWQNKKSDLYNALKNKDLTNIQLILESISHDVSHTLSFSLYYQILIQIWVLLDSFKSDYSLVPRDETLYEVITGYDSVNEVFLALSRLFIDAMDDALLVPIQSDNIHIVNAINYVYQNIGGDTSLNHVAKNIHLSPAYLSYLFRKEAGVTYVEHVNKIRIRFAAKLLRESIKIGEAAKEAGFENSKYFSQLFKRIMGKSPREYQHALHKID